MTDDEPICASCGDDADFYDAHTWHCEDCHVCLTWPCTSASHPHPEDDRMSQ